MVEYSEILNLYEQYGKYEQIPILFFGSGGHRGYPGSAGGCLGVKMHEHMTFYTGRQTCPRHEIKLPYFVDRKIHPRKLNFQYSGLVLEAQDPQNPDFCGGAHGPQRERRIYPHWQPPENFDARAGGGEARA